MPQIAAVSSPPPLFWSHVAQLGWNHAPAKQFGDLRHSPAEDSAGYASASLPAGSSG